MESVLPNKRVIYISIMECFYPLGAVVVAIIASQTKDWKLLLRIVNTPGILFLSYYWLLYLFIGHIHYNNHEQKYVLCYFPRTG